MDGRADRNPLGCAARSSSPARRFHGFVERLRQSCKNREIVDQATRITTSPEMNPVTACARIAFGKI